jgi:nucleotide-binding universal stress UspA family protein
MSETKSAPAASGKPGPVLAAVDFSADSDAAVVWAAEYARMIEAEALVLHVVHDPPESPGFYSDFGDKSPRSMAEVAEERLRRFLEDMRRVHPDLEPLRTAGSRLVTGLPSGRIVEVAEEVGAPLIVVGSRGRTGLPHILLGSVAERVVQTAPVPVVVVKSSPEPCKNR